MGKVIAVISFVGVAIMTTLLILGVAGLLNLEDTSAGKLLIGVLVTANVGFCVIGILAILFGRSKSDDD